MKRTLLSLSSALLLVLLTSGVAMAAGGEGGDNDLAAGAIVGLVFSIVIAGLLVLLSLGYILPKPPGR